MAFSPGGLTTAILQVKVSSGCTLTTRLWLPTICRVIAFGKGFAVRVCMTSIVRGKYDFVPSQLSSKIISAAKAERGGAEEDED